MSDSTGARKAPARTSAPAALALILIGLGIGAMTLMLLERIVLRRIWRMSEAVSEEPEGDETIDADDIIRGIDGDLWESSRARKQSRTKG